MKMTETKYEDGYNEGTIVTWDVGWSMVLPHFGVITRRTPKQITVVELEQTHRSADAYGHQGYTEPTSIKRNIVHVARMTKRGTFCVDKHYTPVWDGKAKWYDYDD